MADDWNAKVELLKKQGRATEQGGSLNDFLDRENEKLNARLPDSRKTKTRTTRKDTWSPELSVKVFESMGLPSPVWGPNELHFHMHRKWRLDFAWEEHKILLEVDGGTWMKGGGGHNRGTGYKKDIHKLNEASIYSWSVLRAIPEWLPGPGRHLCIDPVLHDQLVRMFHVKGLTVPGYTFDNPLNYTFKNA